mmetsp:Transcript_35976/g.111773  ORF Transcript_35976/g.111773 Transcript_35976/m.111773 type:complete len:657 (-) Transcript_35976:112-2082(-)
MFQAGTAFIGGVLAANRIADMSFPQLSRNINEADKFRLFVHVISASIPGLADPGLLKRERPRLEVVLGDTRKNTEFGDFKRDNAELGEGDASNGGSVPSVSSWHFGDTLTFMASGSDVLGPGVQLWLRSNSDVNLGVFQVNLAKMREIGTCSVNLRRDVLPQCALRNQGVQNGVGSAQAADVAGPQQIWETAAMVLPLAHVGADNSPYVLAEAAAHVTVTFGVNVDPQALMRAADDKMRPLAERVATPLRQWIQEPVRWVYEASSANCTACEDVPRAGRTAACPAVMDLPRAKGIVSERASQARGIVSERVAEAYEAAAAGCSPACDLDPSPRVAPAPGNIVTPRTMLDPSAPFPQGPGALGPDLKSDGWVSHIGPNGRQFWHHLSLGPPPWELQSATAPAASSSNAPLVGHASSTSQLAMAPARTPSSSSSAVAPGAAVPFPKPLSLPLPVAGSAAAASPAAVAGPGTPVGTPVGTPLAQMQAFLAEQQQQQQQRDQLAASQRDQLMASAERVKADPMAAQTAGSSGTPLARPRAEESTMAKILERSVPAMRTAYVTQAVGGHLVHAGQRGLPARQSFQAVEAAPRQRGLPARQSFAAVEAHQGHAGLPARTSFATVAEPVWMVSAAPVGIHAGHQAFAAAPATVVVGASHRCSH